MDVDDNDLTGLAPYGNITRPFGDANATIARVPEMDLEGFEIFIPTAAADSLKPKFAAAGVSAGGKDTWEIARIESGRPQWGADMDDTTLPQEANFDELGAISYTKGCYIGQETVARVKYRGHVNRALSGLVIEGERVPGEGAQVTVDGKEVGRVTSAVRSIALGRPIALGYLRREHFEPGAAVTVVDGAGEQPAHVAALPFVETPRV